MTRFEIVTPVKGSVLSLETERLILSVYKPSAAQMVTDYLVRNRKFHTPYMQTHGNKYYTVAEQKQYLKSDLLLYNRNYQVAFWITLPDQPDLIIGRLSFYSIIGGAMNTCFVGYHMDEKYQGKGYMSEALLAGCDFMFKYYRLHRIEADILPDNDRSLACASKCGFEKMGYNEKFMEINGKYQDHVMLVKLNPGVEM